jgi:hypothetical protein
MKKICGIILVFEKNRDVDDSIPKIPPMYSAPKTHFSLKSQHRIL